MTRKDFFARVGFGAAAILAPACITGLVTSCSSDDDGKVTPAPTGVDFTVNTSQLPNDGSFITQNGIVVARQNATTFWAVSAACTHNGTNVNYVVGSNSFHCPNHGQNFSNVGAVTTGNQTSTNLTKYNTTLTGTSLRVYS